MTDRDRCRVASLIGVLEDQPTPHGERVRLAILKAEMLLLLGDAEPVPATSEFFPTPTQNRVGGRRMTGVWSETIPKGEC